MRVQISILFLLVLSGIQPISGQTLPIKTVANPRGEQFQFLPSSNLGMGALRIAVDDPLGDPFTNPAVKGGDPLRISLTPTLYGDKRETVKGRSLPLSAALSGSHWFGTIALAVQKLEEHPKHAFTVPSAVEKEVEEERSGRNTYFLGSIGRQLGTRTGIGFQLSYAELGLLNGVRRLYPSALSVAQAGDVRTLTLGAVHGFGGTHMLRGHVSQSKLTMSYEVTGWRMVPSGGEGSWPVPELWTRTDDEQTDVLEGRLRYTYSIPARGLRFGAMAALQKRTQSETPSYDLVHIPRDPGTSTQGEFGAGMEVIGPLMRAGMEVVIAPGEAHTQIFSDSIVTGMGGATIQPGDPTFDHDFRFKNWRVAGGVDVPIGRGGIELGLGIFGYRFRLEQADHERGEDHDRDVSWTEWAPSLGGRMEFGIVEVRYAVHLVNMGTSPCDWYSYRSLCKTTTVPYHFTGLRVAPTEPEEMPDFRMANHRITVSVPLG